MEHKSNIEMQSYFLGKRIKLTSSSRNCILFLVPLLSIKLILHPTKKLQSNKTKTIIEEPHLPVIQAFFSRKKKKKKKNRLISLSLSLCFSVSLTHRNKHINTNVSLCNRSKDSPSFSDIQIAKALLSSDRKVVEMVGGEWWVLFCRSEVFKSRS